MSMHTHTGEREWVQTNVKKKNKINVSFKQRGKHIQVWGLGVGCWNEVKAHNALTIKHTISYNIYIYCIYTHLSCVYISWACLMQALFLACIPSNAGFPSLPIGLNHVPFAVWNPDGERLPVFLCQVASFIHWFWSCCLPVSLFSWHKLPPTAEWSQKPFFFWGRAEV